MDVLGTVITAISLLAKWEPIITSGIKDLEPFAMSLYNKLSGGKEPTVEERKAITDKLDELHYEFQAPLEHPKD